MPDAWTASSTYARVRTRLIAAVLAVLGVAMVVWGANLVGISVLNLLGRTFPLLLAGPIGLILGGSALIDQGLAALLGVGIGVGLLLAGSALFFHAISVFIGSARPARQAADADDSPPGDGLASLAELMSTSNDPAATSGRRKWSRTRVGLTAAAGAVIVTGLGAATLASVASELTPAYSSGPATGDPAAREATFEEFLATGPYPLVTDIAGWRTTRVTASGGPTESWIVTDAGGVVLVEAGASLTGQFAAYPCWRLVDPYSTPDTSLTFADYADRCVPEGAGWRALDGSGVAFVRDESLVIVRATSPADAGWPGASRPASAAEIERIVPRLQSIGVDELREFTIENWLGPQGLG